MCTCELCGGSVSFEESPDGAYVFYDEAAAEVTAALEAAQASHLRPCGEREARLLAAESRAEALQARVAELEREVESADAGRDSAFDLIEQKNNELDAAHEALEIAESELADLRGRVKRAEDELAKSIHPAARRALEALRGR